MSINYNKINKKHAALEQRLQSQQEKLAKLEAENATIKQALNGTLHEIRRFSAEISENAEILNRQISDNNLRGLDELSKTILYTAGLVSSRLAFTDLELNPSSISYQSSLRSGIYKKFEKASHTLKQRASKKSVKIVLEGNSYKEIDALPAFELVPFVIVENAIKYSPKNQEIKIIFEESQDRKYLQVHVCSVGPVLKLSEFNRVYERGFRGSNAQSLPVGGEGLGLFLVKFLCDFHEIKVHITSDQTPQFSLDNTPFSKFCITLTL